VLKTNIKTNNKKTPNIKTKAFNGPWPSQS